MYIKETLMEILKDFLFICFILIYYIILIGICVLFDKLGLNDIILFMVIFFLVYIFIKIMDKIC